MYQLSTFMKREQNARGIPTKKKQIAHKHTNAPQVQTVVVIGVIII